MLQLIKIGLKIIPFLLVFILFLGAFETFFLGFGWSVIILISEIDFSINNAIVLGAIVLRFLFIISLYFHLVKVWKISIWISLLAVPLIDMFFYYLVIFSVYFQKLDWNFKAFIDGLFKDEKEEGKSVLWETFKEVRNFFLSGYKKEFFTVDFAVISKEIFNSLLFYISFSLLFVLYSNYRRKRLYLENKI